MLRAPKFKHNKGVPVVKTCELEERGLRMNDYDLELLILSGQIRAVNHILKMDIDSKSKGIIEYFWNDLESARDEILLKKLKKIAPNQERLFESEID